MGEAAVIWGRLTEAFWLNCQLFGLTLLFALPLGLVVSFGSMSRLAPLRGVVKTFVWVIPIRLCVIISDEKSGATRIFATDTLIIPQVLPSSPFTSGSSSRHLLTQKTLLNFLLPTRKWQQ